MLKFLDRGAAVLLAFFSAGHGIVGTLMSSPWTDQITLWSFSGSIAAWLIAAMNWLRADRPGDKGLALWSMLGALSWIGLMAWLMQIGAMWTDPRPWLFIVVCVALAAFSLRSMYLERA
jgi:hypothetical protein